MVRLTLEQARKLARHGDISGQLPVASSQNALARRADNRRLATGNSTMNRLESAYADHLELLRRAGDLAWWSFEPFKLRLAKRTTYTPDFVIRCNPKRWPDAGQGAGLVECVEVKALWRDGRVGYRDDARVKIKLAAELFGGLFTFRVVAGRFERGHARWLKEEVL